MIEELKKYLRETSSELLKSEWDSLAQIDTGPLVCDMLKDWHYHYGTDYLNLLIESEPERIEIAKTETPYFMESFFLLLLTYEHRKSIF
jgi:hypothetical protein